MNRAWLAGLLLPWAACSGGGDDGASGPPVAEAGSFGAGTSGAAGSAAPSEGGGGGGARDAGEGGAAAEDPYAPFFDPDRVIDLQIELAPDDWERLRYEGRSLVDVFSGCAPRGEDVYTVFPATVTVDGETLRDVGVRKKGYVGSLSAVRPSLKLDFAELVPEQRLRGIKRMTLNNDRQDPSHTHQCMSYALFRAASVPAPRCNLARVRVNGRDLGLYSHVESIKKPFLEQHFADTSGNLYEGQGADFRPGFVDRLEWKGDAATADAATADHADVQALVDALGAPDGELQSAVEAVLDLEAFERFWAMEVLSSHWDGYSGDLNNYYVYVDPGAGLSFIPWGTDGAFSDHAFLPDGAPASVYAMGELPRRLYGHGPTRERYRARLRELLDATFDEPALLREIDRIAALAGEDADAGALAKQRAFVRGRRAQLRPELDGTAPAWPFPRRALSGCRDVVTDVSATFSTRWGSLGQPAASTGDSLQLTLADGAQRFVTVLSGAGVDAEADPPQPVVRVIGALADGRMLVAQVVLGPMPVAPGEIPLHGVETVGHVVEALTGRPPRVVGLFSDGSLVLEEAAPTDGAVVRGSFRGRVVPFGGAAFGP